MLLAPASDVVSVDFRNVVVVAYDQLAVFEFGIATEVFGLRRPEIKAPWYRCRACAIERGPIRARGGIVITEIGRAHV